MGIIRRSRKPDHYSPCKKHPKHKQSPGVCSICLNERLSRLQAKSNTRVFMAEYNSSSSVSSLSSYYSSESASSCSSPPSARYRHRTSDDRGIKSLSLSLLLRKSRSLAFGGYKEKKEGGFWSKLIRPTRKRLINETHLEHSRTVRELEGSVTIIAH